MTELSREARELIGKAWPAERADANVKKRVRTALALHLALPPAAPPPAGPMTAGTLGAAGSAAKLVLICSLTAAGVVGTAAVVKHKHTADRGSAPQRIARATLPTPERIAQPELAAYDTRSFPSPPSAAGQKSGNVLGDEAPGWQGATRAHSRSYVTEEQRSQPGWIGSQNMAEILNGGTSAPSEADSRGSLRARPRAAAEHLSLPQPAVPREGTNARPQAQPLPATPVKAQPDFSPSITALSPHPRRIVDSTPAHYEPQPSQPSLLAERQGGDVAPTAIGGQIARVTPLVTMNQPKTGCSAKSEIRLLSAAQSALREGHGEQALALLDQHAESCPWATFGEERSAARVLALCLVHRERQALAEAARLSTQAPRSPQLARLRSSCAAAGVIPSTKDQSQH